MARYLSLTVERADGRVLTLRHDTGLPGPIGKSAYQVAVDEGFVGAQADWLASLQPANGEDGEDGANGLSAFEIAQAAGFAGTESEWLASLSVEGPPGPARLTTASILEVPMDATRGDILLLEDGSSARPIYFDGSLWLYFADNTPVEFPAVWEDATQYWDQDSAAVTVDGGGEVVEVNVSGISPFLMTPANSGAAVTLGQDGELVFSGGKNLRYTPPAPATLHGFSGFIVINVASGFSTPVIISTGALASIMRIPAGTLRLRMSVDDPSGVSHDLHPAGPSFTVYGQLTLVEFVNDPANGLFEIYQDGVLIGASGDATEFTYNALELGGALNGSIHFFANYTSFVDGVEPISPAKRLEVRNALMARYSIGL